METWLVSEASNQGVRSIIRWCLLERQVSLAVHALVGKASLYVERVFAGVDSALQAGGKDSGHRGL